MSIKIYLNINMNLLKKQWIEIMRKYMQSVMIGKVYIALVDVI